MNPIVLRAEGRGRGRSRAGAGRWSLLLQEPEVGAGGRHAGRLDGLPSTRAPGTCLTPSVPTAKHAEEL